MGWYFIILFLSLTTLWLASELIITSLTKLTRRLHISAFAASFFILGMLTSIPEISIGLTAVLEAKPVVFVGNLIGASIVLIILIIPLLAVAGNGINVSHNLPDRHLIYTLLVVVLPAFFTLDGSITRVEGVLLIVLYLFLFYLLEKKRGFLEAVSAKLEHHPQFRLTDLLKIAFAGICIYVASRALVESLTPLAGYIGLPPFFISLLILSIGTNLPETFIGVQAVINRQKDIAFGDYVGSAAANTCLFGIFVCLNGTVYLNGEEYWLTFGVFCLGLALFYLFVRSKQQISRREGLAMLLVYAVFITVELLFK